MKRFLAAAIAATACSVNALTRDDFGLYDRVERHVGPAHAAWPIHHGLVASTDAGVLASIDAKTARIGWRHVAGPSEVLLNSAPLGDSIIALVRVTASAEPNSRDMLLVRLLSATDGVLSDEEAIEDQRALTTLAVRDGSVAVSVGSRVHSFTVDGSGRLAAAAGSPVALPKPAVAMAFVGDALVALTAEVKAPLRVGGAATAKRAQLYRITARGAEALGKPIKAGGEGDKGASLLAASLSIVPLARAGGADAAADAVAVVAGIAGEAAKPLLVHIQPLAAASAAAVHKLALPAAAGAGRALNRLAIVPLPTSDRRSGATIQAAARSAAGGVIALHAAAGDAEALLLLNTGALGSKAGAAASADTADDEVSLSASGEASAAGVSKASLTVVHAAKAGGRLTVGGAAIRGDASAATTLRFIIAEAPAGAASAPAAAVTLHAAVAAVSSDAGGALLRSPSPVSAAVPSVTGLDWTAPGAAAAHGFISRAFVLPLLGASAASAAAGSSDSSDGGSGSPLAGARYLLVREDGAVALLQGSRALWVRAEGGALLASSLTLEVGTHRWREAAAASGSGSASSSGAGTGAVGPAADAELSLPSRIGSQVAELTHALVTLPSKAISFARASLFSVIGMVPGLGGGKAAGSAADAAAALGIAGAPMPVRQGAVAPLPARSHTRKVVVACSSAGVLSLHASVGAAGSAEGASSGVLGSLHAVAFEDGGALWSVALPLAPALRAAAADAAFGSSSSSVSLQQLEYESVLLASRARPVASAQAELLLVETARNASTGGYVTWVTWLDGETGAVTGSAPAHAAAGPLESVARLPAVHAPSGRDIFAITHAAVPSKASASTSAAAAAAPVLVAPADAGVLAGGSALLGRGLVVLSNLEYDAAADTESLAGYALDWASKDAALLSGASAGSSAIAVGAALVPRQLLWRMDAARRVSASAASGGERVLAFALPAAVAAGAAVSLAEAAGAPASAGSLVPAAAAHLGAGAGGAPAHIFGDDSVQLKWRNPSAAMLAVGPAGAVASAFETARATLRARVRAAAAAAGVELSEVAHNVAASAPAAAAGASLASLVVPLVVSLVDLTNGRTLHASRHSGATGPVAAVLFDNWMVHTMWNARYQRPEIASAALFEGPRLGT